MCPAEVLLRYLAHYSKRVHNEWFKGAYLPFIQARQVLAEVETCAKSPQEQTARVFSTSLLTAVDRMLVSQYRIERKIAALRIIEALRLYAASHDGHLPNRLDQVKIVPIPLDPGTDQAFEYHLDGQTATLTSRIPGETLATSGLRYRVTVRKAAGEG
jgi:hypothetical protein